VLVLTSRDTKVKLDEAGEGRHEMHVRPWVAGLRELLQHGLDHLAANSDFDSRMALISIDNAVELMFFTYLRHHSQASGKNMQGAQNESSKRSFHALLRGIEEHAPDKLVGVSRSDLEYFHALRNNLYHNADGITVERSRVSLFAELSKVLMMNFFDVPLESWNQFPGKLERFLADWAKLNRQVAIVAEEHLEKKDDRDSHLLGYPQDLVFRLREQELIPPSVFDDFNRLQNFKDDLVFRRRPSTEEETHELNNVLQRLIGYFDRQFGVLP
jgi:hypothetical protein